MMSQGPAAGRLARFGVFEIDLRAGELHKNGLKVKIQDQPFQVLSLLLEHPGELVTREEVQQRLWPDGTFVDFEHSLNVAVKKLREALGDDADNPRFIETVPRRGYKFIAPVDGTIASVVPAVASPEASGMRARMWRLFLQRPRAVLLIVLGIAAAAAGGIVLSRAFMRSRIPEVTGSHQLTSGGFVLYPSGRFLVSTKYLNPLLTDGSRIYFSVEGYASHPSWVGQMSVAGGDISHLPLPFRGFALQISSDNAKLLVKESLSPIVQEGPLWEMSTAGGSPIRLGDVVAQDGAWSPDGRLSFAKGKELYLANRDGSQPRKLLTLEGQAHWIRWSPDGSRLRFTLVDKNQATSLWEVSADGADPHPLLPNWNGKGKECCGEWSPDGQYFVFTAAAMNRSDIFILLEEHGGLGRGNKDPIRLTNGPISYPTAIFSRDGKKLFAVSETKRRELTKFNLKTRQLEPFLVGVEGADVHYSYDERWITYAGPSREDSNVWRSRSDGTERLQLTRQPLDAFSPRWSPDGKHIAFMGRMPGGPFKLYLIPSEGGTPRQLIADARNESDPDWSPDGRTIIFGRQPDLFAEPGMPKAIHLFNLATGQLTTLLGSEGLFAPRWSRGGRYVAACTLAVPSELMLFDFVTQKWKRLGVHGCNLSWAHDGRSIYAVDFFTEENKERLPVYRIWIDGRVEHLMDLTQVAKMRFVDCGCCDDPAPDNSPILYCASTNSNIFALDLDLP